jgi:hypothetical protein
MSAIETGNLPAENNQHACHLMQGANLQEQDLSGASAWIAAMHQGQATPPHPKALQGC